MRTTPPRPIAGYERQFARALAMTLIDCDDWDSPDALRSQAVSMLGRRPRWLPKLIRDLSEAFPRAPRHDLDLLSTWLAAHPSLRGAHQRAHRDGRRLKAIKISPGPSAMGPTRWKVHPLDNLGDLADFLDVDDNHLAWFSDSRHLMRRAPAGPLHHYRYHWIARTPSAPRLLEAPLPQLRRHQRRLLRKVFAPIALHPNAHGFVPGRSARTGAEVHVASSAVLSMDLTSFFTSIPAARIRGVLRSAGYPDAVATSITGLVTTSTPMAVLADLPPGGTVDDRALLRSWLRSPHLPQGAPSSPHVANLVAFGLDARLSGYAAAAGWRYTRYGDDLTFSSPIGGPDLARRRAAAIRAVTEIAHDEGFRINASKTRLRRADQRQLVTGIVVNERISPARDEYDRLKAILHNAFRSGAAAQNRDAHPDFGAHLRGRIAWVAHLNPERGARLLDAWEQIDWRT